MAQPADNCTVQRYIDDLVCVAVQWYVLSAVAGLCLLSLVAGTTVCVYRCYRRRRSASNGAIPPVIESSPSVPEVGSPLDGQGVGGGLKHGGGVGSVQHSRGQPQRKSADQHGDGFHGPSCTVAGDHGVVYQVNLEPVLHVIYTVAREKRHLLVLSTQWRSKAMRPGPWFNSNLGALSLPSPFPYLPSPLLPFRPFPPLFPLPFP